MFDTACASLVRLILLGCLLSTTLRADDLPPLLGPAEESAVADALRCLKMTPADLSYKKDYSESPFRLGKVQRFLEQPMELPRHATIAQTRLLALDSMTKLMAFSVEELERRDAQVNSVGPVPLVLHAQPEEAIPSSILPIVRRLMLTVGSTERFLDTAFTGMSIDVRQRAVARYFTTSLHLDRDVTEIEALGRIGFRQELMREMIARNEALEFEDDDSARDLLPVFATTLVDQNGLMAAASTLGIDTDTAASALLRVGPVNDLSPNAKIRVETRLGPIIIGGAGPTHYTMEDDSALLIIDLGGDDAYDCRVGAANSLIRRPISICIDLGGNDTYRAGTLSQGAGVFGVGILVDCGGNDIYEGKHLCQGVGLYGVGILADYGGEDTYTSDINAQGAGMFGAGVLWDKSGNDHYVARQCSQGYGCTGGIGLLLDGSGNDTYFAGGKYSDHERQPEHYLSLSQGFGNGMRSDASGGVGILCDRDGDDTYVADMFGQGASYWYSLGMLLDAQGNDLYRCHQYGQGAGIHLSCGILADWQGDDQYIGGNIVQGTGHDWSVGMLFDKQGNDTYIAKSTAQGSALYNSTALLVDSAGDDTYTTPKGSNTQAAGHDGWTREYGTIALLLDLGGKDAYSNGPQDNVIALKPLHGCALDIEKERLGGTEDHKMGEGIVSSPSSSLILHPSSFASTPMDISRPQNDQERRWLKLIRQASQYEDTERKARDKYLAWEILLRESHEVLPFWLRQCDHDSGPVRIRLEQFVDTLGATNAAPALIEALAIPNDLIRRNATYFIGKLKVQGAVEPLRRQLPNEKLRAVSLWALGQVKAKEALTDAVQYLTDTNEVVRVRATGTLGKLGEVRAVPHLIKSLDDDLWDVRYSAQAALIKIGKPSVRPMLAALPKSSDRARPYLIEALGRVGDWRTAKVLRRYLQSANPVDRGTAVAAIANLNPSWTEAECRRLLKSETDLFVVSRLHDATEKSRAQK